MNKNRSLENIAIFGFDTWAAKIEKENLGRRTAGLVKILANILDGVREAIPQIGNDTRLTKEGQKADKAKLGAEALDGIRKVEIEVPIIEAWTKELEAAIRPQVLEPSKDPVDFLAEREVRDLIRKQDDASRVGTIYNAVDDGDTLTIRAFVLAPKAFPLLLPDVMEKVIELLIERAAPEKVEVYKAAIEGLEVLKNGVKDAKTEVGKLTGIVSDPLAILAAA